MPKRPPIARTVATLRKRLDGLREQGATALVPTMGALHAGHLSLVRLARRRAKRVVVSIFVNPQQFGPAEDLSTYPRTFDADLAALTEAGVDLVWAPATAQDMYPEGFATTVSVAGPAVAGLEDAFRPHFFAGVATVVAKLLIQCRPDFAMFGEKDFQQLRVVTQMARDLDIPVKIVGGPTIRERDGLAMSSRNVYLSADERAAAPTLYRVLRTAAAKIADGGAIASTMAQGRRTIERAGFKLDYLEARHTETLAPITSLRGGPIRLLVAARLGRTRLIDNIPVRKGR